MPITGYASERHKSKKSSALVLLFFVLAIGAAYWWRFSLYDWWRLRSYTPPPAVVSLANDTTMQPSTRRLFYVYRPQIEDGQQFNSDCRTGEKTIVLGCYVNGVGIYLFNVTDERLKGVEEVTAAHETLHAAYARLSPVEKKKVDDMTAKAYAAVTDARIRTVVASYQSSGADVPNELHSILGTEVANLLPDLEAHYSKYFRDRAAVVAFSEKYEQEFTGRQQKVVAYDAQLKQLKSDIDQLSTTLTSDAASLNVEYARINSLKSSGQISAYNSSVSSYNKAVNSYNDRVARQEQLIRQYNQIVKDRNALAVEENELAKAIDSRPQTLNSQ